MTAIFDTSKPASDRLHKTVFQVKCDHPSGQPLWEYGVNVFLFVGPTAAADAEICKLELLAVRRGNVKVAKQEHWKIRRIGYRVERDVFRWSDVAQP